MIFIELFFSVKKNGGKIVLSDFKKIFFWLLFFIFMSSINVGMLIDNKWFLHRVRCVLFSFRHFPMSSESIMRVFRKKDCINVSLNNNSFTCMYTCSFLQLLRTSIFSPLGCPTLVLYDLPPVPFGLADSHRAAT